MVGGVRGWSTVGLLKTEGGHEEEGENVVGKMTT